VGVSANSSKTNARGITSVDLDGVDMATFGWEKWWSDPQRNRWGGEAGRDPQNEAAKIRRGIEPRERP
jgi:hypothetical protein